MKPTNKTYTKQRDGHRTYTVLTCKLTDLGQGHYLSCTYEEHEKNSRRRDSVIACGAADIVSWHKWGLAELARWHLCNITSGPMHYVANAIYWAEHMHGLSDYKHDGRCDPIDAFQQTVVFGAVPGDEMPRLDALPGEDLGDVDTAELRKKQKQHLREVVSAWCEARRPALMAQFEADLRKFGLVE